MDELEILEADTAENQEPAPSPQPPPLMISLAADKSTAFGWASTFDDLCRLPDPYGRLFQTRLAETRLLPTAQELLATYRDALAVVALVTPEDPDTIAVLPVVARMVAASPRMNLRIVTDEEDPALLRLLLEDHDMAHALEEWDLPQLFWFDEDWELQAQWGPRPAAAEPKVEAWLRTHPAYEALAEDESPEGQRRYTALTRSLSAEMRVWYNSSLATAVQTELCELLTSLQSEDEAGSAGELAARTA